MAEIKEREIRLLEDRLKNLNMGLNEMGSENVMVNKEMLTAVRDYMAQLLGLLRRPAPENKALTCEGCESADSEEMCEHCSRAIRNDLYSRKPEEDAG